jgi:arylsulfatase A-like enzyme
VFTCSASAARPAHTVPSYRATGRLLLLVLLASGCGRRENEPRGVVLVTVDTLRADHLGAYGYRAPTSPYLDALARESTLFESAITTCPATAPALASLLTGLHRAAHGVRRNGSQLPPTVRVLAEILKEHGFHTAAVVANPIVDHKGFERGFDTFTMAPSPPALGLAQYNGETVLPEVERVLDRLTPPFFVWVHFMDPHGPYFPPADYRALFDATSYRWPGEEPLPLSETNYGLGTIPRYQQVGMEREPAGYRARYDAEVRYTDDHLRRLVGLLQTRGLWQQSLFVLTADHGESLGEHDYYFQHGWFLYDDALRVPLLLRAEGVLPAGQRVAQTVSLIDIAPTVLNLLGLPPPEAMEGRSLLALIRGREKDHRPVFAESEYGNRLVALRLDDEKYIFTPRPLPSAQNAPRRDAWKAAWPTAAGRELYDLATDPGETANLATRRRQHLHDLARRVRAWRRSQAARALSDLSPLTPEIIRQLRALGYVD